MLSTNRRRSFRSLLVVLLAVAPMGCGEESRPDFDINKAQVEIAEAFSRRTNEVAILGDARVRNQAEVDEATWIVDFTLDGFDPFLQAKFEGKEHAWRLASVRERATGPTETPWSGVGVMLGRFRGAVVENAEDTERRMRELAAYIERYTVENGNRVPATNLDGIRKLVVGAGYIDEAKWRHGTDGWGGALAYHGAPEGTAYILVSPGADGRWDISLETYFFNTDQGIEIYDGDNSDPNKDIVWASGAFVQRYRAE